MHGYDCQGNSMIWIEFKGIARRKVGGGMAFNCNIMNESTELSFLGGCVLYVQTRLWTLSPLVRRLRRAWLGFK
jgi:hypothetical protein